MQANEGLGSFELVPGRAMRLLLLRVLAQVGLAVAGTAVMLAWEPFWRDRPYLLAIALAFAALVIGPWPLAVANQIGLSLLAFYLFIQPYRTWGIATTVERDYTLLYAFFLIGLNTAWWLLRRAHQQALQERAAAQHDRDLLAHVLSSGPLAVTTLSPTGDVLYANDRAERLLGARIGARYGRDFGGPLLERTSLEGGLVPPEEGPLPRVLATGQSVTLPRARIKRPDGVWRVVDTYAAPILDAEGKVQAVVISGLDVTEEHEADQRLRVQQERLERIAATLPGVVFQYAAETAPNKAPCFCYLSPRTPDFLGVSVDALLANAELLWTVVDPRDQLGALAALHEAVAGGGTWVSDFRLHHPARGMVWLRGEARPTRLPNGALVWNGIWLDVTAQKQLELELLQSQKLESVGQLAGGIAHDFNNLLTVILGYAESIELDWQAPTAQDDLEELKRAVHRAAGLTNQLLAFTRRQLVQPAVVDLGEPVRDMEKLLRRLLGANIALVVVFEDDEPAWVFADPGNLQQVLLNLAVNARDAMAEGGRLVVRVGQRRLDTGAEAPPGHWRLLEVSDSGVGMTPEVRERIFEPFFTTKAPGKGTGLGLATVQAIVTQAGGHLAVDSALGSGTTFRIYFPAVPAEASKAGERDERRRTERGPRRAAVLLVDDDESVRVMIRRALTAEGYGLLEARHGHEAVALYQARAGKVDVVVTDVVMPGMSGPELVEQLRAGHPHLPVLFLSGFVSDHLAAVSGRSARQQVLAKPFTRDALLTALDGLLQEAQAGVEASAAV